MIQWPFILTRTHNRIVSELMRSIDRKNKEIKSLNAVVLGLSGRLKDQRHGERTQRDLREAPVGGNHA